MLNEEMVALSVVEYCDLLIAMAEFNGHKDPHKVNWDYFNWYCVVSEERYYEASYELVERGYESWMG
jgi:hypothetical protein